MAKKSIKPKNKKLNHKNKKLNNKKPKKQKGGLGTISIPSNTGTSGSLSVLTNDIWAVVGSTINTMIYTINFIGDAVNFKSDMGAKFNDSGAPGA